MRRSQIRKSKYRYVEKREEKGRKMEGGEIEKYSLSKQKKGQS